MDSRVDSFSTFSYSRVKSGIQLSDKVSKFVQIFFVLKDSVKTKIVKFHVQYDDDDVSLERPFSAAN